MNGEKVVGPIKILYLNEEATKPNKKRVVSYKDGIKYITNPSIEDYKRELGEEMMKKINIKVE